MEIQPGTTLYLVCLQQNTILEVTYQKILPKPNYYKFFTHQFKLKKKLGNRKHLTFNTGSSQLYTSPKIKSINQVREKSLFCNQEFHALIYDNEQQALDVYKKFILPINLEVQIEKLDEIQSQYMMVTSELESMEKRNEYTKVSDFIENQVT